MARHKGINDTDAPIYLVSVVTITGHRRDVWGSVVPRFRVTSESFTDRDEAHRTADDRLASLDGDDESTAVHLTIKRPGSRAFVALREGE